MLDQINLPDPVMDQIKYLRKTSDSLKKRVRELEKGLRDYDRAGYDDEDEE